MYKDFNSSNDCGCIESAPNSRNERRNWGLKNYPLASVYSVLQGFDKLYDEKTAHKKGTIFSELDLPFMGESIFRGGNGRG